MFTKISFETFPFPIFLVSILTLCSGILTPPKVWMSEYSYLLETMDSTQLLFFPVHPNNSFLNNSFIFQPNSSTYFLTGNLTCIVFTCEANYPIYWTVSRNVNQISPSISMETINILKSLPNSTQTNSSNLKFSSLLTIFLTDSYDDFLPNSHGNWLFTCHNGNQSNQKSSNINLNFGKTSKPSKNIFQLENKIGIAILTEKSPVTMTTTNKRYLDLADVLNYHYLNYDDNNNDQLSVSGKNISINYTNFVDSFNLTKILVELNTTENVKDGDKIQILCYSSDKFDYAIGGYLEVSMETGGNAKKRRIAEEKEENIVGFNGSKRIQVELSEKSVKLAKQLFLREDEHEDKWLLNAEENMVFYLTEEFSMEKGVNKVECHMPLWRSGQMDKVSTEINVIAKEI